MSVSRDTLLFGIALVVFATWIETSGMGGWPFAITGFGVAAFGFLGRIGAAVLTAPDGRLPIDDD